MFANYVNHLYKLLWKRFDNKKNFKFPKGKKSNREQIFLKFLHSTLTYRIRNTVAGINC